MTPEFKNDSRIRIFQVKISIFQMSIIQIKFMKFSLHNLMNFLKVRKKKLNRRQNLWNWRQNLWYWRQNLQNWRQNQNPILASRTPGGRVANPSRFSLKPFPRKPCVKHGSDFGVLERDKKFPNSSYAVQKVPKLEEARCSKNSKNRGAQFKAKKYPKVIYWSEFATFLPCSSS